MNLWSEVRLSDAQIDDCGSVYLDKVLHQRTNTFTLNEVTHGGRRNVRQGEA